MPRSAATTVTSYLAQLPAERRAALTAVRDVIRKRLPPGYEERMNWGMISYEVPLERYADTYNGQPLCLAGLASHKHYASLYLMPVYGDAGLLKRLKDGFKQAGKRLDMGKSCIHFGSPDDLALDVIGDIVASVSLAGYVERAKAPRTRARKIPARRAS